ncbi:hypothetical protein JNUCC0626_04885 [Lentzea sp. JNUCC 0626]|uniref:hypothetical protein n=1 Tax=Lentzea sp. JNUCC 0626 TaxID=3367513 RepID=UPI00374806E1
MKRTSVAAGVLGALVLASTVASPQAVAAACQYNRQDLPLPAGVGHTMTNGSSTNNSRIAGQVDKGGTLRGVYWVNSTLRELPAPSDMWSHTVPQAVNNTSVVAGYEQSGRGGPGTRVRAFRFENGAYQYLETDPGSSSKAVAINDAGDVLGIMWSGTSETFGDTYLWPRTGPRRLVSSSRPIGITNQGKVVVHGGGSTRVLSLDGSPAVEIPGMAPFVVLDNDRILRREPLETSNDITEWDLGGTLVATHQNAWKPFGRNGSGTMFGVYDDVQGNNRPALWRKTGRTDVVADFLPIDTAYSDVTDAATLIGTYIGTDNIARPARWLWVCS